MLFASLTFLLGFLPLTIAGALIVRRTTFGQRGVLVFLCGASFLFYGWHYPPYVLLLSASIIFNYILAQSNHKQPRRNTIVLGVFINLALLGWFKYAGFLADMVATIAGTQTGLIQILLPLGISFFSFQQIAYLVDIHKGKAVPGSILEYVFFISFFPQLIAGPIVHHRGFISQLSTGRFASFRAHDVAAGALLFCIGLGKKILIADSLAPSANTLFATQELGVPISLAESWLGMLSYTFQIYFDFSGYTNMALGLGLIFGLSLPENFRSPYKSTDIIDFWRRWNITLSIFLRDYLYFPLGGNRRGPLRRYVNLWIVMLLGGLWHGAGLQFIVWGALHGFYLSVNHWWLRQQRRPLPNIVALGLTFIAVIIAWVFFRASDVGQGFDILRAMVGRQNANPFDLVIFDDLIGVLATLVTAAVLAFGTPNALDTVTHLADQSVDEARPVLWFSFAGILAGLSLFHIYASGSYAFIYFQF